MISIIVCSINPTMAKAFVQNIKDTIGIKHEIIIHDNRGLGAKGIASVYNICAERARYDNLLFVHEDVIFTSQSWGLTIVNKLSYPTCGVVGFAGATIKSKHRSGWGQLGEYNHFNYVQHFTEEAKRRDRKNIDSSITFAPVLTLDGLALFVRRDVWAEFRFDEEMFRNFHCYDLDFSLQVSKKYNNYICNCIDVEHLSCGSYNDQWVEETALLHDRKWAGELPMYLGDLSEKQIEENERMMDFVYTKTVVKNTLDRTLAKSLLKEFIKRNRGLNGSWYILIKYLLRKETNR